MFSSSGQRTVLIEAALLLISCGSCPAAGDEPDDPWVETHAALRVLWTGAPAERRIAADGAFATFFPLFEHHEGGSGDEVPRTLASLRSLIRSETDDLISYRLLEELGIYDEDELTPLFLDALKSRSPNLRWIGIRWFARHVHPRRCLICSTPGSTKSGRG